MKIHVAVLQRRRRRRQDRSFMKIDPVKFTLLCVKEFIPAFFICNEQFR